MRRSRALAPVAKPPRPRVPLPGVTRWGRPLGRPLSRPALGSSASGAKGLRLGAYPADRSDVSSFRHVTGSAVSSDASMGLLELICANMVRLDPRSIEFDDAAPFAREHRRQIPAKRPAFVLAMFSSASFPSIQTVRRRTRPRRTYHDVRVPILTWISTPLSGRIALRNCSLA